MVKHVILWKFKDGMSEEEKTVRSGDVKKALEGLSDKIEGLIDIHVNIEKLPSSNADMMLDSTFTSEEALKAYQVHPDHVSAAEIYVRPYTQVRLCMDYDMHLE